MPKPAYAARLITADSLEQLQREMKRIAVDHGGIPIMASKGVQRMILLEQIPTAAANIIKQEILARGGDLATPWSAAGFDAPKVDCIVMGNLTTLRSTISKLFRQTVFDLQTIADIMQTVLVRTTPGYLPVASKASRQGIVVEETLEDLMGGRIPLQPGTNRATGLPTLRPLPDHDWQFGRRTYLCAQVDSPEAVANATEAGAHMLETDDLQLLRDAIKTAPNVTRIFRTADAGEAQAAVGAGAQIILDLSGATEVMLQAAATSGALLALSYPGGGDTVGDIVTDLMHFYYEALERATASGLPEEHLLLDAGLGIGKSLSQELTLLNRLTELTSFGRPVLFAPPGAGSALGAAAAIGVVGGAHIVRTRRPVELKDALHLADSLKANGAGRDL